MTTPPPNDADLDPLLRDAVTALRAPVTARSSARAALRSAIAAESRPVLTVERGGAPPGSTPLRWFTTPRAVRVSPLGMLAAATLLMTATAAVMRTLSVPQTSATGTFAGAPAAPAGTQVVRFSLAAPQAREVALVGDFNGWDPSATALRQQDGTWSVVIPVTPGRHQYGFVIDGATWIADPQAARSADADFGTPNSVMYVGS